MTFWATIMPRQIKKFWTWLSFGTDILKEVERLSLYQWEILGSIHIFWHILKIKSCFVFIYFHPQEHIETVKCRSEEVRLKFEECEKNAKGGHFSLHNLLNIPMQRILKYPLLLRELTKYSSDQDDHVKDKLNTCLEAMQVRDRDNFVGAFFCWSLARLFIVNHLFSL